MSPNTWNIISTILLISGIVFLLLTIILSVKFQLIDIIRDEINNHKNNKYGGVYFAYGEKSSTSTTTGSISSSVNMQAENIDVQKEDNTSSTEIIGQKHRNTAENQPENGGNDNSSVTVLVSYEKKAESNTSNTVVISSGKKSRKVNSENDFVITENIIVIHGNLLVAKVDIE